MRYTLLALFLLTASANAQTSTVSDEIPAYTLYDYFTCADDPIPGRVYVEVIPVYQDGSADWAVFVAFIPPLAGEPIDVENPGDNPRKPVPVESGGGWGTPLPSWPRPPRVEPGIGGAVDRGVKDLVRGSLRSQCPWFVKDLTSYWLDRY